jgi:hypothetical protein
VVQLYLLKQRFTIKDKNKNIIIGFKDKVYRYNLGRKFEGNIQGNTWDSGIWIKLQV